MLNEIYKTLIEHQGEPITNAQNKPSENKAEIDRAFDEKIGKKFGVNEKMVLLLLSETPTISAAEIAERTGLSKRGVEKQIKKFRDMGIISRIGSDKGGHWIVNAE
ncbi:MAG: winged helix-turn-helix transcriptional regulator [Salinivirgaceae bacterium]|nr:winged helix-turn-helix transcriptional regulator [Salinivirgaceae bacterium]